MIVITTPTGNIGGHVLTKLLETDQPLRVILRDPTKLPNTARGRVEVIVGSHSDAATVYKAFEGASAVFWLCPPTPHDTPEAATVEFTRPAAEAIQAHGVGHIVAATTLGRGTSWQDRAGMATASIRMVDLLRRTGAAVRGLALPGFIDNARFQLDSIRAGCIQGAIGPDQKLPHVATRDVGAIAADLLADRSWSGQIDVPVLGPEDHSYADLSRIISEETGFQCGYEQVPFEDWKARFVSFGWPERFAEAYVAMLRAKDEGMDNAVPRDTAIVGPTSFRQWVREELRPLL
jgi:uncharacterized protein YbjT (DUF2867 family)